MAKNESGKQGKNRAFICITFSIFGVMFLMVSGVMVSFVDSFSMRKILFCILCALAVVCTGFLIKLTLGGKLSLTAVHVINVLMFAGVMGYVFWTLFTSRLSTQFMGNNAYAAGYSKDYAGNGSDSKETCIREALRRKTEGQNGEKDFEEIYRIERGDVTWVFFGGADSVLKFECILEDNGQYYLSGSSSVIYHGFFEDSAYSDIETVKSDVANCISHERRRIADAPVWGVTGNPNGAELSINGIKADFTLEIKDTEGKSHYFWVLEDIGDVKDKEDIENLSIEGLL